MKGKQEIARCIFLLHQQDLHRVLHDHHLHHRSLPTGVQGLRQLFHAGRNLCSSVIIKLLPSLNGNFWNIFIHRLHFLFQNQDNVMYLNKICSVTQNQKSLSCTPKKSHRDSIRRKHDIIKFIFFMPGIKSTCKKNNVFTNAHPKLLSASIRRSYCTAYSCLAR